MTDRWIVSDPEGHAAIVEANSLIEAVHEACSVLSVLQLRNGTTLRVQHFNEQAPRFDVGYENSGADFKELGRVLINGDPFEVSS